MPKLSHTDIDFREWETKITTPGWRNGLRAGLRNQWEKSRAGSSPVPGTIKGK
jgi:hypothetical protein